MTFIELDDGSDFFIVLPHFYLFQSVCFWSFVFSALVDICDKLLKDEGYCIKCIYIMVGADLLL